MSYKIQLLEQAKSDLLEARDYYNTVLPKLGKRFANDFESVIIKVQGNRFSFSSRIEGFRTANLKTFPFQVHYLIEDVKKEVIVFAILHAHRNPQYISSRLKK